MTSPTQGQDKHKEKKMERNVVTLDTAKKLKAAGFPQEAYFWYDDDDLWGTDDYVDEGSLFSPDPKWHIAAPTAQEIADQLREYVKDEVLKLYWGGGRWTALIGHPGDTRTEYGRTMAEALALTWLILRASEQDNKREK
jgi:hypothetical protein